MPFSGLKAKADTTTTTEAEVKGQQFHAVKMTSDWTVGEISAAADVPLGLMTDNPQLAGDGVTVATDGDPVMKARAGGTIVAGSYLVHNGGDSTAGHRGRLITAPTGAGTYYPVGIAMEAAVDNDLFMVRPLTPRPTIRSS